MSCLVFLFDPVGGSRPQQESKRDAAEIKPKAAKAALLRVWACYLYQLVKVLLGHFAP